jgi:ATP sulfurylase
MLKITILHKCGHYALHTIAAKNEQDVSIAEIRLSSTYCKDCQEAVKKHNSNPANTKITI